MAKRPELTAVAYVIMEDGEIVPFDEMTEEQRTRWQENTCKRLSERMSDYYTQHPDQYQRLCAELDAKEERLNRERNAVT